VRLAKDRQIHGSRRRAISSTLAAVALGGTVGWTLLYTRLGAWGPLVGLAVTALGIGWVGARHPRSTASIGGAGLRVPAPHLAVDLARRRLREVAHHRRDDRELSDAAGRERPTSRPPSGLIRSP
jgi:hypothetical protein